MAPHAAHKRKPKLAVPSVVQAEIVAPIPKPSSWLRFVGLGIIEQLLLQTREIAALVKDVSDETQAMSATVDSSHNTLKRLAQSMQERRRPRKSVTRGRKK